MRNSILTLLILINPAIIFELSAQNTQTNLPERKQTTLGLYVTAREAYDMWQANPDNVKLLDVRTLEEYIFVGHPEKALNIPAFIQTTNWDKNRNMFAMVPNPEFITLVQKWFSKDEIILAFCRSGDRSAMAVNILARAGFTKVYTITDGFEGDKVMDTESLFHGKPMVNGWKNAGIPWTYTIDPKLVILSN